MIGYVWERPRTSLPCCSVTTRNGQVVKKLCSDPHTVEAPTREAAMQRVRCENPHIEIRECWEAPNGEVSDGGGHQTPEFADEHRPPPFRSEEHTSELQ